MEKEINYYVLNKVSYPILPGQLQTAAVLSCRICDKVISGMGGGRIAICTGCGEKFISGNYELVEKK